MAEKLTITLWDDGEIQVHEDGQTPTNYRFDSVDFESLKMYYCKFGNLTVNIQQHDKQLSGKKFSSQTGIQAGEITK